MDVGLLEVEQKTVRDGLLRSVEGEPGMVYLPRLVIKNGQQNEDLPPVLGPSMGEGEFVLEPGERYAFDRQKLISALNGKEQDNGGGESIIITGVDRKVDGNPSVVARVMNYEVEGSTDALDMGNITDRHTRLADYYSTARAHG